MVKVTDENLSEIAAKIGDLPERADMDAPITRRQVVNLVGTLGALVMDLANWQLSLDLGDESAAAKYRLSANDSVRALQKITLQMVYGDPENDNG